MSTDTNALLGAVESGKDSLVREFKGVVGNAHELMNEMATSTARGISAARSQVGGQAREAVDATQDYVRGHPWQVLAGAAVAGFLVGLLSTRR